MKKQITLTKRLFAIMAGLGLAAWGTGVANAQLINGNWDATSVSSQILPTPTGWTVAATLGGFAFNDGASSEPWNNVAAVNGFGVFYKTFFGDGATSNLTVHIFQDNAATAGLKYTLRGWAGAGPGYSGFSDPLTKSELAVEFLDAGNSIIGGSILDLVPAGLGTGTTPGLGFGYLPFVVSATAPVGAVSVRSRLSIIEAYDVPGGGDAAFVGDNFTLTVVPEPTTLTLLGLGLAGLVGIRRRS